MHKIHFLTGGALFVTLIAGFGYAITTERPIAKMKQEFVATNTVLTQTTTTTHPTTPTSTIAIATTTKEAKPTTPTKPSTPTTPSATTTQPTTPTPTPATTPSDPNIYTSAQVAQHNSAGNCWASIDGNVYNLTTWVARHPGGESPITRLCGTDGSAIFQAQHGSSRSARAALVLLKIGSLK